MDCKQSNMFPIRKVKQTSSVILLLALLVIHRTIADNGQEETTNPVISKPGTPTADPATIAAETNAYEGEVISSADTDNALQMQQQAPADESEMNSYQHGSADNGGHVPRSVWSFWQEKGFNRNSEQPNTHGQEATATAASINLAKSPPRAGHPVETQQASTDRQAQQQQPELGQGVLEAAAVNTYEGAELDITGEISKQQPQGDSVMSQSAEKLETDPPVQEAALAATATGNTYESALLDTMDKSKPQQEDINPVVTASINAKDQLQQAPDLEQPVLEAAAVTKVAAVNLYEGGDINNTDDISNRPQNGVISVVPSPVQVKEAQQESQSGQPVIEAAAMAAAATVNMYEGEAVGAIDLSTSQQQDIFQPSTDSRMQQHFITEAATLEGAALTEAVGANTYEGEEVIADLFSKPNLQKQHGQQPGDVLNTQYAVASDVELSQQQHHRQQQQHAATVDVAVEAAPAVDSTATNAYEDQDADLATAPESGYKLVYSVDDPATHTFSATTNAGEAAKPTSHRQLIQAMVKQPATAAQKSFSTDDFTLGRDQQQKTAAASASKHTSGAAAESSAPGGFTGGSSVAEQHAGHADEAKHQKTVDCHDTLVTETSAVGIINKNIFGSLNNDLASYLDSGKAGITLSQRRQMLSTDGDQSIQSDGTETASSNKEAGPSSFVQRPLNYPDSAYDLSAAAVQAARAQVKELQEMLAAKRESKVHVQLAMEPDFPPDQKPAQGTKPGHPVDSSASKSHRKLIDVTAQQAAVLEPSDYKLFKEDRAGKPLWGVTYSWRRAEGCNGTRQLCRCPPSAEVDKDLDLLYKYSYRIRTYSVECPELMRMMLHYTSAHAAINWLVGVWIGKDSAANKAQVEMLAELLKEFPNASLAGIIVGNEAITRGDVKESQLIEYMKQVRKTVRSIGQDTGSTTLLHMPVLTAEQPAAFTAKLIAATDVLGAVIQPFFTGAVDTTQSSWVNETMNMALKQYHQLQQKAKGKQVLVTEIGWPSKSGEVDDNRACVTNSAEFAKTWVQVADGASVPYYYHELADAGWKAALRQGAAAAAATGRALKRLRQQPSILTQGVLGDEHFGLVTAARADKGLLSQS